MIYVHSVGRASRYYPELPALAANGASLSFRDLHDRVRQVAAALRRRGLRFGDRLALLLPNGSEYIELIYACAWLGVIAVPLNIRLSQAEIDRVLEDATPGGIVRHSTLPAPRMPLPWEQVVDEESLEFRDEVLPSPCYDPEAVLALIYTSGTTGRPKGVMATHANIFANVHNLNYWMRYRKGGVYLHAAPIFHIADFPALFAAPACGARQIALPKFQPQSFCEAVERERVTHTVLVPTMINLLTQSTEITNFDLSSLEVLAYGGSPMAPELIRRTRELLPNVKLLQVYGLSETGFLTGLEDQDHTEGRLLSCGKSCIGTDVEIVDKTGNSVEAGQSGELVARGANVMRGYWNQPYDTARAFQNGKFRTGDIGYRDSDGFIFILDRMKDMIVTGGENVYSGEVEAVIYQHPAVREVAVFGVPDPNWGELVTACVVRKSGAALTAEELIAHCRRTVASYKVPRRVEFSETELPKSGTGKVLKRAVRERFWAYAERAVS